MWFRLLLNPQQQGGQKSPKSMLSTASVPTLYYREGIPRERFPWAWGWVSRATKQLHPYVEHSRGTTASWEEGIYRKLSPRRLQDQPLLTAFEKAVPTGYIPRTYASLHFYTHHPTNYDEARTTELRFSGASERRFTYQVHQVAAK